jgi:hypothetical protein
VLNTILQSPIAVQEIIKLGEKVKQRKVRLKDVVRDADDEEGYNEEEVRKRVETLTDDVEEALGDIGELDRVLDGKKVTDARRRRSTRRSRPSRRRCSRRCRTCAQQEADRAHRRAAEEAHRPARARRGPGGTTRPARWASR